MRTSGLAALLGCCLMLQLASGGAARSLKQDGCTPELSAALKKAPTDESGENLIVWGTKLEYASGTVRAYTKFAVSDPCKGPSAMGVEISDNTLDNLPGPANVSVQPPPSCTQDPSGPACHPPFDLMFLNFSTVPLGERFTPFPVMELDWNPEGHFPPGIYNAPHFDFHFYMVGQEEVQNITAGPCGGLSPEAFSAANQPIPASCFPGANYTNLAAVAPFMGNHMLSTNAPEIAASMMGQNGLAAWNQTFIWGTYDGQVTFLEPMVKRIYLLSKPDECWDIPGIPADFAVAGYRPQTYCITSTDDSVKVEVMDFKYFEGGCADKRVMAPASYARIDPNGPPLPKECVVPQA